MARAVTKLRLADRREALLCLPARYADCRQPLRDIAQIHADKLEESHLFLLTLTGNFHGYARRGDRWIEIGNFGVDGWGQAHMCRGGRVEIEMRDSIGRKLVWTQFGGAYQAMRDFKDASSGDPVVIVAKIGGYRKGGSRAVEDVQTVPPWAIGRIWTHYQGIAGLVTGAAVETLVRSQLDNPDAFAHCAARLTGVLGMSAQQAFEAIGQHPEAEDPLHREAFTGFEDLLRKLHQPATIEQAWAARNVCHRLSALSLQAEALRHHRRASHPDAPLAVSMESARQIAATQPEQLTEDQMQAIEGIIAGLKQPQPLNALLTGDVGTGKTLAYAIPAVAAHRAGARVAIIAPTDLLANQIASTLIERFGPYGVSVDRVSTGAKKLSNPQAILVSTYGLTSTAKRCGYSPHLLICDEQHKMSAAAREGMVKPWTSVIEATATPIPRSLAASIYEGMSVFTLRKCPVEKDIQTALADVTERGRTASLLRWALANDKRAAIIYPLVEDAAPVQEEGADLPGGPGGPGRLDTAPAPPPAASSVTAGFKALQAAFPGQVSLLHGKLSEAEKNLAIAELRSGAKPIVVSSTVMETGIDVPSLAVMVVRNADSFSMSQLHQLRGRLARNGGQGWFVMLVDDLENLGEEARARLQTVCDVNNGFDLSEMDLIQRGFGDVDGAQQSGASETVFRLVKLSPEDFLLNRLRTLDTRAPSRAQERLEAPPVASGAHAQQMRLFA